MRLITSIALIVILLSCSSELAARQETTPASGITMLEDTTVSYDRLNTPEITLDKPTDSLPKVISTVNPRYPEAALRDGIKGNVIVQTLVSPSGRVRKARILKSDAEILNHPALEAVMKWRFEPPVVEGKPVAIWLKIPFRFALSTGY